MKKAPAMSKKQEVHFLQTKARQGKKGQLPGLFHQQADHKKIACKIILAGKSILNCRKKIF